MTHDAFFRALMDEPGVAAALLREHLPAEVAALLTPDAPELLDGHFVAAHLRHSQADRGTTATVGDRRWFGARPVDR